MFTQFERLVEILGTIPRLEVIETSEESTGDNHRTPAVIVDFAPGDIRGFLESNVPFIKPSYSLVICVEKTKNAKKDRRELNALGKTIFDLLIEEYGSLTYGTPYPHTIQHGKGDALCYGIEITLPEEPFFTQS